MKSPNRKKWVTSAVVVGAFAGSAVVASAVTSSTTTPAPATSTITTPAAGQTPAQVPVADTGTKAENDANEATEPQGRGRADRAAHELTEATHGSDAKLLAQATVTADQAKAAALKLVPGTADTPDIHDWDGVLAFNVRVTTATGETEVTVDAKTGVAAGEAEGAEHHGHGGRDGGRDGGSDGPENDGPNAPVAPSSQAAAA